MWLTQPDRVDSELQLTKKPYPQLNQESIKIIRATCVFNCENMRGFQAISVF
jgi:hypothetical protein